MNQSINSIEDVKAFAEHLVRVEKLSFHPDDDFKDYVKLNNQEAFYSEEEANLRNKLMNECFEVCEKEGVEIYELMLPILHDSLVI
jgi:hypothetical protein